MSESFDPYYHWLSIPPEDRPPHAYRLLGLKKYEPDREVIAHAADRQMAHVKSYASGPHGRSSQLILNELAKAKRTLIDPARKTKYDESLRSSETPRATRVQEVAVRRAIPLDESAALVATADRFTTTVPRFASKQTRPNTALIGHIIAPIVGLLLGCLILAYILSRRGGDEPQVPNEAEANRRVVQMQQPSRPKNLIPATKPTKVERAIEPQPAPVAVAVQPAPEPVAPADPFEQFGDVIAIPSLAALDRVEIAKILLPKDADLMISLAAAPIADRPELEFRLGEGSRSGAQQQWDVLIAKLPDDDDDDGEVKTAKIGGLTFAGDALSFYWTDVARQLPSGQLRNCVLHVDVGGDGRDVALRKAVHVPPLSLELVNTVERLQVTLTDRPDEAAVYFQLMNDSVIRSNHEFDPADARVQLGQRLTIKLPQTEVRLRPYARDDELTIETIGRYKIAGKEYPLTVERVNKQLQAFQRQLVADQNELRACQRKAYELRIRLANLTRMRVADSAARKALEADMIKYQNLSAKNARRIESLVESIPFLQASVQQLPQVANLGNALQSSSKLHYRVFVMLENHEVDLLVSDDTVTSLPGAEDELPAASDEDLAEIQDALSRLEADPADAEANLIVGRHYCLQQNKWSKGLPLLARCNDEKLAAAASMDLENASEAEGLVAIGDAWYDLAASKGPYEAYLARAQYCYQLAKPDVAGLLSVKVNARLKEIGEKSVK